MSALSAKADITEFKLTDHMYRRSRAKYFLLAQLWVLWYDEDS